MDVGARGRGQKCRGTLHADRDLLATPLEDRVEVLGTVVSLKELLRFVGGEATLALQILAETAGTPREVTRGNGDAVVGGVYVGGLVAGVHERPHNPPRGRVC